VLAGTLGSLPVAADSSSPLLAAFYERKLAVCGGAVFQWSGNDRPAKLFSGATAVGVGRDTSYALLKNGHLVSWTDDPDGKLLVGKDVRRFSAGRSGVLIVRTDNSLWWRERVTPIIGKASFKKPVRESHDGQEVSVGDSANYFVTSAGDLFVKGKAHRGQYGDGKLQSTKQYVSVAASVASIKSHTWHAILLKTNGEVLGTGGNIYGPVGRHGIGDKAVRWSPLLKNSTAIATGFSHTLAIDRDGTLWGWGRDIGLDPKPLLKKVSAAAADSSGSIALRTDGTLWQWERGGKPEK